MITLPLLLAIPVFVFCLLCVPGATLLVPLYGFVLLLGALGEVVDALVEWSRVRKEAHD